MTNRDWKRVGRLNETVRCLRADMECSMFCTDMRVR